MPQPPESTSLVFKVDRHAAELVAPSQPTPREWKSLSDIDDQKGLRTHIDFLQFYRSNLLMADKDPAKLIREALAKTLVFYYPFAGRLREGPNQKLLVECTGEGVLFTEADADVTLEQFGDALQPPFPCFKELLHHVPGFCNQVLNFPLLLVQVTRLKCGGFIVATCLNHGMSDAPGLVQFLSAVSEIARGSDVPSVLPVWERDVLCASNPPQVTQQHQEYEQLVDTNTIPINDHMVHKSFFVGPTEISTLKKLVPPGGPRYSTFEILAAYLWKCRTMALQLDPMEEVRLLVIVNARNKFNSPLPIGYYGNGIAFPTAVTTARQLCQNPIGYALDLVRKAKEDMSEDYMRSVCALMVSKGRPMFTTARTYALSDTRHVGFQELDFGWGKPIYGGIAGAGLGDFSGVTSFISFTNSKGENGIVVPLLLPSVAMERFAKEFNNFLTEVQPYVAPKFIRSSL